MSIVLLSKHVAIAFVPSYGMNKKSKNPLVVGIKPLSHTGVQEQARNIAEGIKDTDGSATQISQVSHAVQRDLFLNHVTYVKNCVVDYSNEEPIMLPEHDIKTFYDTADSDLIGEIIGAMESQTKLREGQLKNSEGVSDSDSVNGQTDPPSIVKPAVAGTE
jgi:hypothetical protein